MDSSQSSRKRKAGDICCFCGSKRWKAPTKHYYRFPTDPIRSDKWAALSGKDSVIGASITERYSRCRVCEDHFTDESFRNRANKLRLHPDATPQALTSATPDIAAMKKTLQAALAIESTTVSQDTQSATVSQAIQPTAKSSTASVKRIFSTFCVVHSKLRNRLGVEKASKLVFVMKQMNS